MSVESHDLDDQIEQASAIKDCEQLKEWANSLGLGRHYTLLLESGLDGSTIFSMETQVLNDIMKEIGIPVSSRTRMLVSKDDIAIIPKPDGIVVYSADSKTNPTDKPTDVLKDYFIAAALSVVTVTGPCMFIGIESELNGTTENLEIEDMYLHAFLPAMVVFALLMMITPKLSLGIAIDTMQERTRGVDTKDAIVNQLINSGVVGALVLTIVLAAMQVGLPTATNRVYLCQWYIMLLTIALFYSMASTVISTILLMYLMPLADKAAEDFIGVMAMYIGEPMTGIVYSLVFSLDAMVLWIWGQFDECAGIFACVVVSFGCFRMIVVTRTMVRYHNPFISADERTRRSTVVKRGGISDFL